MQQEVQKPIAPEVVIDGFRVKKLLGEGSMGEIYLAVDEHLGRKVALKFVKTELRDSAAVERFVTEAKTTARFNHPNIVTVYGAGVFQGRPYIALEYLDGSSLRDRIDSGPLPVREVMRVARAVAEGLADAHAHGVIHADLKPENVVVPRDGRPRVVDFGLAGLVGAGSDAASGTPAYMAPERWAAAPPATSIDIWAFGVVICEALDGRRPLSDREIVQLAYTPKPVTLGPVAQSCPCSALLAKCLSPRPEDRPSAAEIANVLEGLLVGRVSDETRSPFRGLEPFTEADAQDFHGRAPDTDAVVERLRTDGLLPIVGPSGVGKSSFIQAGVVPRLRELSPLVTVNCRPGRRPLSNVVAALVAQGLDAGSEPILNARTSPGFLVRALRALSKLKGSRVLLIIDQFEEAVTLGDPAESSLLINALAATALPDPGFRVLLGVRSDFLGSFASTALEASLASVIVLRPLGPLALEEAFLAPLRRVGYRPDQADLPKRMAAELLGQSAALPLLQFAADALWRRRDAGQRLVLTREYDAMGGASGALATHAERLAHDLSEPQRVQTCALMLQLVNVDGTRRPRTREELLTNAIGAGPALDLLLTNRLLVSGQNEETGEPLIELAHESLVTTWPALARWLAETQEARRLAHEIEQAANLWASRGRAVNETWIGDSLRDAERHVVLWKLMLTPLQQEFLAAGASRQQRLERRRRLQVMSAFVVLGVLVVSASALALIFKEKERAAIAQQQQIRMAAADIGHIELVIEPFDWNADEMTPIHVNASTLPELNWVLHTTTDQENVPGPPVNPEYVTRGVRHVTDDGALSEIIDVSAHPSWLEITGRGVAGQKCASSWLMVKRLPGYADRDKGLKVRLKVPTCNASLAGTVEVPGGPFYSYDFDAKSNIIVDLPTYRIDTYEVTQEAYGLYAEMRSVTGDEASFPVEHVTRNRRKLPMTQLDALMSARYCLFMGKQLPSVDEWRKAARGGLHLDTARLVPNPTPKRETPWGSLTIANHANLARVGFDTDLRPVGTFVDDCGPYGAFDLMGGVEEWTRQTSNSTWKGARYIVGGSWVDFEVAASEAWPIDGENVHNAFLRTLSTGARCVLSK